MSDAGGSTPSLPAVEPATVIVPSKDRPVLARRAVRALLDQQGATVEVVVVDDGSSDPLDVALADLVDSAAGRLRVLRNERSGGVARARQRGLDATTTPWVGFCDDDDLWAPTKVSEQLQAASSASVGRADPVGWTCSGAITVDDELVPGYLMPVLDPARALDQLQQVNAVPGGASSVLARTDLVCSVGGWDPDLSTLADWDLWVRLAAAAPLAIVERPLTAYLLNAGGMSLDVGLLDDDLARMAAKYAARDDQIEIRLDRVQWLNFLAYSHLRSGRRFRGAVASVGSVRHGGPPRRLAVAAIALVSPSRAVRERDARQRQETPDVWIAEAERWLAPLRSPTGSGAPDPVA